VATIDHVTIRSSDLGASLNLFARVFDLLEFPGERHDGAAFYEWDAFSVAQADREHPPTQNVHIGFAARTRDHVDAWWQDLIARGYSDDGAPGPRPQYSPSYYGAFIRDHDDNSIEAVTHDTSTNAGAIDHLWIRVHDLDATRRFYTAIAGVLGLRLGEREDRLHVRSDAGGFTLLEGRPTKNVHLAIGVSDEESVRAFHRAGLDGGGIDNGAPGERPEYHRGYYGAYLKDADGNNIEAVFHNRSLASTNTTI
jgi:catechol 2,3-dioxygenase-like lactoylglutathione lyase family enzyme